VSSALTENPAPVIPPEIDDPRFNYLEMRVRDRLRDYAELNRLTSGYDHSPRLIKWAIYDTLGDWASTPPFIGVTLDKILERQWTSVFILGVTIELLRSLSILHMRNYLSYSDGGVNVQTENPQLIMSWLQMAQSEYEQKKQRILIAANIESSLGSNVSGVHGEYYFINSFFGYL
jgi:hypothetical protein